jgi:raffinose/stachyose/melibiose transport system substrate-binding protein
LKKAIYSGLALLVASLTATACGPQTNNDKTSSNTSGTTGSGKITLQFLQNKQEAVGTFNKLIKKFEAQYPNIQVTQINPPDADTVLKTDLAKNKLPDVIAMGGDAVYTQLVQADVLYDFSKDPSLKNINPEYLKMLANLTGSSTPYGIPFSANAQTILYNKDIFAKLGLSVPHTWNELIATAQKAKAKGVTPFYFGFKDSWTTMIPWNSLAANAQSPTFFSDLKAGKTTMTKVYSSVADKMLQLASYGQQNKFGVGYNDANTAFAQGKSAMYVQGIWAIPPILQANPKIHLGAFPFPATASANTNKLVSGVDTVLTVSNDSPNRDAALKFVDFLLQPNNAKLYITEQKEFSAVKGVKQTDPVVAPLQSLITSGHIVDYPDHYYPTAMQFSNLVQNFLMKKNKTAFLSTLDKEYKKAEANQ